MADRLKECMFCGNEVVEPCNQAQAQECSLRIGTPNRSLGSRYYDEGDAYIPKREEEEDPQYR